MELQVRVGRRGDDGPAIVLLHGIPGSAAVWDRVAEGLASSHRVVVPDLLGFGWSDRPDKAEDLWAHSQADALIRALESEGIERAVFVGHDFGGPVALAVAAQRAELMAGLCLAATNAFGDTPIPLPIRAVTWPLVGRASARLLFSRRALRIMLGRGASRPLEAGDYLGDDAQVRVIGTIFAYALRNLDRLYSPLEAVLRSLRVPLLVAWGDKDPFFAVEQGKRTAEAATGGRLVVYEGAGHFLPSERPDQLVADIRELVSVTA